LVEIVSHIDQAFTNFIFSEDMNFHLLYIICRTPEWLKKIFAAITKSERNGPVFRFFIDLGDAG